MLIQRVVRRGLNHLRKRQNGKNDFDVRVTSGVCRTTGVIVPPLQRVVQANDQQMSQVMEQETLICPMMMSPLRVKKSRSIVQRILKIELECVVFLLLLI
ncbi:hypothetical protein MRB53_028240 [Persea americana]|uniref:Uncharacterized protein n=1 Tax=Persea americana TaxID=3435 RepID=A0ACC2KF54_PERAE|nr:hypothetical protein MRB53_028240 [Persea americana]